MMKAVMLRVAGEVSGTILLLAAIVNLPLANATAILQVLPLAITLGAALTFGEPVGWRRWLTITSGFIGVLIVVRPGVEGFNQFSLFALISVIFCAMRDLANSRQLSHLAAVFAIAKPAWAYPLDQTAMKDAFVVAKRLGIASKSRERDRRPALDELDKILEHFGQRLKRRPSSIPMQKVIGFAIFSTRRLEGLGDSDMLDQHCKTP